MFIELCNGASSYCDCLFGTVRVSDDTNTRLGGECRTGDVFTSDLYYSLQLFLSILI